MSKRETLGRFLDPASAGVRLSSVHPGGRTGGGTGGKENKFDSDRLGLKCMWESQAKSFLRSGVVGELRGYCREGGCFLEVSVCKTFPAISLLQNQHSLSPNHSEILPGHVCMCAPLHSPTHAHTHTHISIPVCMCTPLHIHLTLVHTLSHLEQSHVHTHCVYPHTLTTHTPSLTHAVTHSLIHTRTLVHIHTLI